MHSICVLNMIQQSKPLQTRYNRTYIYDRYYIRTHVYVLLFSVQKRVFVLSCVWAHAWYLSGQSFIIPLKLVWREQDIVVMNDWKKNCVGLQWTWVSKRTVIVCRPSCMWRLCVTFLWKLKFDVYHLLVATYPLKSYSLWHQYIVDCELEETTKARMR